MVLDEELQIAFLVLGKRERKEKDGRMDNRKEKEGMFSWVPAPFMTNLLAEVFLSLPFCRGVPALVSGDSHQMTPPVFSSHLSH